MMCAYGCVFSRCLICCALAHACYMFIFFFNDSATTDFYTYLSTLSLHDALSICQVLMALMGRASHVIQWSGQRVANPRGGANLRNPIVVRQDTEEHTSELQSLMHISYAGFCLKKKMTEPRHNT